MQGNPIRPFRFPLERWIQKGILAQLLLMAGLVASVAVLGGLLAWATTEQFANPAQAIWWAFLRLTDPGYLGDDEGTVLRVISTGITVLGYVLFMGSMIAIMTQWLAGTLKQLESGITPIAMKDHVVILGWTNRTPEVILKLLTAQGRLERFLVQHSARKLRIVVLSDEAGSERRHELREYLGPHWSESQVFLRSGSSLMADHLERLDLLRASVVLIPGADFELGGSELSDTRVVKTLMTLRSLLRPRALEDRPHVVAEIFDPLKVPIATGVIEHKLEVVASNRIISRLISQSVRHRGLAQVLFGIFSHRQGNTLYLRDAPELAGHTPRALAAAYDEAIVIGFLRRTDGGARTIMDPCTDELLRPDDLLILMAESYAKCAPTRAPGPVEPLPESPTPAPAVEARHDILVLGWSHKVGALISELDQSSAGHFEITIMSRVEPAEREHWLSRIPYRKQSIGVRNVTGDYSTEADLAAVDPAGFDHVVMLASDWMDSSEAADARTILGYALLTSRLREATDPPEILIELLDPDNSELFENERDVVLVTPRVLSHLQAHVALRPELNCVFDDLFGAGGWEIELRPAASIVPTGQDLDFEQIRNAALAHGMTALGVMGTDGLAAGIHLNPRRDRKWRLGEGDCIVVLARDGRS